MVSRVDISRKHLALTQRRRSLSSSRAALLRGRPLGY